MLLIIFIAQSNPSFEIWLYYHFYSEKPTDADVEKSITFKEFVHASIHGGFDFNTDQSRLSDAITNAESNFSVNTISNSPELYSTEMHILGKEIYSFVKNDLAKLKNKLR